MRIIEDKYNSGPFALPVVCGHCTSSLVIEEGDIELNQTEDYWSKEYAIYTCPVCTTKNLITIPTDVFDRVVKRLKKIKNWSENSCPHQCLEPCTPMCEFLVD